MILFGSYIGVEGKELNISILFTSLILVTLLANPLIYILQLIPSIGASRGCFVRLQEFLEKPEKKDSQSKVEESEKHEKDPRPDNTVISENIEDQATHLGDVVVSIRNGSFGWASEIQLKDINLEVQKGEHVAITGPVGCGKSLLLQATIQETALFSGTLFIKDGSIGYCSQTACLENITIEENIFRDTVNDRAWRQTVIEACSLSSLIATQEPGETIGSGGSRISGGERQRMVMFLP